MKSKSPESWASEACVHSASDPWGLKLFRWVMSRQQTLSIYRYLNLNSVIKLNVKRHFPVVPPLGLTGCPNKRLFSVVADSVTAPALEFQPLLYPSSLPLLLPPSLSAALLT